MRSLGRLAKGIPSTLYLWFMGMAYSQFFTYPISHKNEILMVYILLTKLELMSLQGLDRPLLVVLDLQN